MAVRLLWSLLLVAHLLVTSSSARLCSELDSRLKAPCQCDVDEAGDISVDCDYVVFEEDFPLFPFKMQITEYRQRYAGLQGLTSQLFTASQIPLNKLDFSHNGIRKLNGRVFEGLENGLESLMLQHNRLGDVYPQTLALPEISKLVSLKNLNFGYNEIQALDMNMLRNLTRLQVLQLEGNSLLSAPTEALLSQRELKVLTLQENDLDSLPRGAFSTTPKLIFLNVSHNQILAISDGAFGELTILNTLDLSHNRLTEINALSFQGLQSVENLDLSSNFLIEIPADALKETMKLKKLQIQNNQIQTLGGIVALGPAATLTYLDLTRNNIVNLESKTFKRLTNLHTLKLSVNSGGKRNGDAFEGLDSLETLELDDHRFISFPSTMLAATPQLRSLSLNYNRIKVITTVSLRVVNQLEKLSMANNIIQEIPDDTFQNFTQLRILNLNGNKITKLDQRSLSHVGQTLEELDLGNNLITVFPELDLPHLSKLTISMNKLIVLPDKALYYVPNLQVLDLKENKLSTLPVNAFESLSRLATLDLSYNELSELPTGQFNGTVISVINLQGNKIKKIASKSFQNLLLLTSLDISHNEIEVIEEGAFHDVTFLHILNLKNNLLTSFNKNLFSFPRSTSTRLRYIDLSNNDITFLKDDAFTKHPKVNWLSLSGNRLSFFPSNILKNLHEISQLHLSDNEFEGIDNPDFANSRSLRELDLSKNKIIEISEEAFQNSSQLQELNLKSNKIKHLYSNSFKGIARLKLDLSYNELKSIPDGTFDRSKIKLHSLNLAHNQFQEVPVKVLRSQYYFFSDLNMAHNNVSNIPNNADILVNMKSLDLSYNPLTTHDISELLNEPKLLRNLNLAGSKIDEVPLIEARFLVSLNLSDNNIKELSDKTFTLTHNLRTLDLSYNNIPDVSRSLSSSWAELPNLRYLDISHNPIGSINEDDFKALKYLKVLKASNLSRLTRIDPLALSFLLLEDLELYGLPMVDNIEVQEILDNMLGIESVDIELTKKTITEDLRGAFTPRLRQLTVRGPRVNEIESSAFLNLNSPSINLGIIDTNVSTLNERILFLVPMSTNIELSVNNSHLENLSEKFLENVVIPRKRRLTLVGLENNPLYCDCNLKTLRNWILADENNPLINATCDGPNILKGRKIKDLLEQQLVCSERITEKSSNLEDIITKDDVDRQIIKTKEPEKEEKPKQVKFTSMDKIIIGVVGGVIGFVALLILLVCLVRLLCDPRRKDRMHPFHTHGNCTCVKPPIPPVGYPGSYTLPHPGSRHGTLKSLPPTTPIPPPYGTLGAHSRGSYYSGPPSYMGMYPQDEHDYR